MSNRDIYRSYANIFQQLITIILIIKIIIIVNKIKKLECELVLLKYIHYV
jgi:hypothetical protein